MALASEGPIQIGRVRSPCVSCKTTTGVFVERSRPKCATFTSTIILRRLSVLGRSSRGVTATRLVQLVAVVFGLVRPFYWNTNVLGLFLGEHSELHTELV